MGDPGTVVDGPGAGAVVDAGAALVGTGSVVVVAVVVVAVVVVTGGAEVSSPAGGVESKSPAQLQPST
ncbi:MAG: hypothetical protein KA758_15525, partial [Acidimicrobiales bacterium]|nr:hypothetical protein [Acidimicrobiales bacterium]